MDETDRARLGRLVREQRWAALATLDDEGAPHVSHVAYALDGEAGVILHLSQLAPHTRHLRARPRMALAIGESDPGAGDPQELARVTVRGRVTELARGSAEYEAARACYLARLPLSARLFDFGDFRLFRCVPDEARYVGGFARARRLNAAQWRTCAGVAA